MAKGTKEKILDEALRQFSQKGYDGTNIRELTASLGLVKSSMYKHFGSKEDIWNALLDEMIAYYNEHFGSAENLPPVPDSLDGLVSMTMQMVNFTIHDERVVMTRKLLTIEQFRDERFSRNATKYQYDNINGMFTGIFADLIKKGMVEAHDPEQLALMYYSPVSVMIQICDREPERIDECMKKIEDNIDLFIDKFFIKK